MSKVKKAIVSGLVSTSLVMGLGLGASAKTYLVSPPKVTANTSVTSYYVDSKEGVTSVSTKEKNYKFYDGTVFKIDRLDGDKLTDNKYLQKIINKETVSVVREMVGSEEYKKYKNNFKASEQKNVKVKVNYRVTKNREGILSIRANYYLVNKTKGNYHEQYATSGNFNYDKKVTSSKQDIKLKLPTLVKSMDKLNEYLKKETERQYGKAVSYPIYNITPEYYDNDGSVVVEYLPSQLGKTGKFYASYLIRVPKEYFNYSVLKTK